ncbi:MAG TPA: CsgG/HfaB family protein [Candidatus Binatia bacterium]|nr:CsgG/HfaB family protein [Candidatus Binatia bacterium]
MRAMGRIAAAVACGVAASACAPATVNKASVRATDQAPESTQVEVVRVPYDPNYPYYVVTVEPLRVGVESSYAPPPPTPGVTRYGWGSWGWGLLPTGPQAEAYQGSPQTIAANVGDAVAAQLETALTNAGNIRVIDYDFYQQNNRNPAKLVNKKSNEVGPFVIRGTITEFNEVAEATGSSSGGSLGALGAALAIGGAIAGNNPATYTGVGVAAANPTYQNTEARRTGSVAMDLKVVQPTDGRIVGSVMANGSFTSESAANGFSLFGFGKASNAYAASALGQAQRAAMNSATTQIVQRLQTAVP